MKTIKSLIFSILLLCIVGNSLYAQQDNPQIYLGGGFGFDYGGLGAKFEFLPVKYVGLFGGAGYNFSHFLYVFRNCEITQTSEINQMQEIVFKEKCYTFPLAVTYN